MSDNESERMYVNFSKVRIGETDIPIKNVKVVTEGTNEPITEMVTSESSRPFMFGADRIWNAPVEIHYTSTPSSSDIIAEIDRRLVEYLRMTTKKRYKSALSQGHLMFDPQIRFSDNDFDSMSEHKLAEVNESIMTISDNATLEQITHLKTEDRQQKIVDIMALVIIGAAAFVVGASIVYGLISLRMIPTP